MTENMKLWLRNIYSKAAEEHLVAASNEHLWALGAPSCEAAAMHEDNADENRAFAMMLREMAENLEV